LPSDLTIIDQVPGHKRYLIKWILNGISIPIETGGNFWFHYAESFILYIGKLSDIHNFIGRYALIKVSPIMHFDQERGWITDEEEFFWIDTHSLILNSRQKRHAQRAFLQHPYFTLLNTPYE
jgi:hypothetical protein